MMNKLIKQIIISTAVAAMMVGGVAVYANKTKQAEKTEAAEIANDHSDGEGMTGIANPNLYELRQEDVVERTGITLTAPDQAENVTYSVIDYAGEHPIAEMDFTFDNREYFLRAQATDKTDLYESEAMTDINADYQDFMKEIANVESMTEDPYVNISGIHTKWETFANTLVGGCNAVSFGGKDGAVIVWIDPEHKILYNLCSTDGTDTIKLQETADMMFQE